MEKNNQKNIFGTTLIGNLCYNYSQVESTNQLLSDWIKKQSNLTNGLLITADHQTKGRGRLERKWLSKPESSLLFSFYLKISKNENIKSISSLPLVIGLAIAQCLQKEYNLQAKIKWPNDILINSKKLSGILCQSIMSKNINSIIGIGMNINQKLEDFSEEIKNIATSIFIETSQVHERLIVLKKLLNFIEDYYFRYRDLSFANIKTEILDNLTYLNEKIKIQDKEGILVDISENGALLIKNDKNKLIEIYSGDVEKCY